jgi:Flp pilus assembly protein TadD
MSTAAHTPVPAAAPSRPAAFFVQAGRRLGPLTRDELVACFGAGLVGGEAMIVGPEWDGALPAAAAAEWLGVALRTPAPEPATASRLPPAPLEFRRTGPGWRVLAAWALALLVVQMMIVPAQSLGAHPGLAVFVGAVAWRFALVAASCFILVGGVLRLARGLFPGARWPLLAMTGVYAVLAVQFALLPKPPATAPVVAAAPVATPVATPIEAPAATQADPVDPWSHEQSSADSEPFAPAQATATVATPAAAAAAPAADSAPTLRATRVDPDPQWTKAHALFVAGDWNALLAHALAWTRDEPRDKNAWVYLGLANERLGRRMEAIAANRQAYKLDPDDLVIGNNLGITLLKIGAFREAADVLASVLERTPDAPRTLSDYGFAMSRLGEYDEAVAALEHAVKVDPADQLAWENLIAAHLHAGFVDLAKDASDRRDKVRR